MPPRRETAARVERTAKGAAGPKEARTARMVPNSKAVRMEATLDRAVENPNAAKFIIRIRPIPTIRWLEVKQKREM